LTAAGTAGVTGRMGLTDMGAFLLVDTHVAREF
jgi:hypothetical protein